MSDGQDLTAQVAALRAAGDRLAADLRAAGAQLQERADVALGAVAERCVRLPAEVDALRERLRSAATAAGLDAPAPGATWPELEAMAAAIDGARAVWQQARAAALQALDRVLHVAHRDGVVFGPLGEVHSQARDLHVAISAGDLTGAETAAALQAGSHPLARLVLWLERGDSLGDEEWQALEDEIVRAFGRPIAVAVARRKLVIAAPPGIEPASAADPTRDRPVRPEPAALAPVTPLDELAEAAPDAASAGPADATTTPGSLAAPAAAGSSLPSASPPSPAAADAVDDARDAEVEAPVLPAIDSGVSLSRLAVAAQPPTAATLFDIAWCCVRDGRLGLAYHVAEYANAVHPEHEPHLPAWLVRAAAVAQQVACSGGELAAALRADLSQYGDDLFLVDDGPWRQALRLLLVAASVRPALLAPESGAAALLLEAHHGIGDLFDYCSAIASFAHHQRPLDPNAMHAAHNQAAWEARMQQLRAEASDWCAQAPAMTIKYAQATKVWQRWHQKGELMSRLLGPVCDNDAARADLVRELLHTKLANGDAIREEINHTDRKVFGRRLGQDIAAGALSQLLQRTTQGVAFARRWLDLLDARHVAQNDFWQSQIETLRREIERRTPAVLRELDALRTGSQSLPLVAAARCCHQAVEATSRLFEPGTPFDMAEPDLARIVHLELLKTGLPLNDAWGPEAASERGTIDAILELAASDPSWTDAFTRRMDLDDHESTARIIEILERSAAHDGVTIDALRQARHARLTEAQQALRAAADDTRLVVERAVAFGLVRDADRATMLDVIERTSARSETVRRFEPEHRALEGIRTRIDNLRAEQVAEVRSRLAGEPLDAAARRRVDALLDGGDVLAANEYVDMARKGLPLPEEADREDFARVFPDRFRRIAEIWGTDRAGRTALAETLRQRAAGAPAPAASGPVEVSSISDEQARSAEQLLRNWSQLRRAESAEPESVKTLLALLGFEPIRVARIEGRHRVWFGVECEPLADRERCPIAALGSSAAGRYRILCVWGRPTEEDLLAYVGETTSAGPVIVLYFGPLSTAARQNLSALCRRDRRTFIVVDDVIVTLLLEAHGSRLAELFRLTLPFTHAEPYLTTAGIVPPEMFYGRARERKEIVDPFGSCFIYGGRQLGKTALLRHVQRAFHQPARGQIALWLDLRAHGIGYDRTVDEVWDLLADEFKKLGVVPASVPVTTGADKLLQHVEAWLAQDRARRVLLLLDEADRFLEEDGRRSDSGPGGIKGEFVRAGRLKGLMDRTERRFKVVFAGLHNVQRTTRLENHPLAHYGEAICIGPLLDDGQWRQAWELVERPLASIGYQFSSRDLVTRILSQTNYYPSLIQLFCNQLLRHVRERHPDLSGPPFVITDRHVEDAYQNKDLRGAVRDRFRWTLDLDQRYRVIAYCLALHSDEPAHYREGFTPRWIRDQALTFWPEGFRGVTSEDAFRVLLDEMVGLGVLRVEGDAYALRSINVVSLLGTREEIEQELETTTERETPLEFEAQHFRKGLPKAAASDVAVRSPLTAEQFSELRRHANGVSMLFGFSAAGLDEVDRFLELEFGSRHLARVDNGASMAAFGRQLDLWRKKTDEGVTLLVVPESCGWNERWVQDATERLARLKSKNRWVRVVFIAAPATAWRLPAANLHQARVLSMSAWHDLALRQWLDDCGFGALSKADRAFIRECTGNWPLLLREFHQRCQAQFHRWRPVLEELTLEWRSAPRAKDLRAAFGLFGGEVVDVLRTVADYGEPISAEDVRALGEASLDHIRRVLRWAELLGLVQPTGNDRFALDPVVAGLLADGSHDAR